MTHHMKIPKYMQQPLTCVGHPSTTLRAAAKAIKIEATKARKEGFIREAQGMRSVAISLERMAKGESAQSAFHW
jgi:hypothetical protein